jgi:hypothetical protein
MGAFKVEPGSDPPYIDEHLIHYHNSATVALPPMKSEPEVC